MSSEWGKLHKSNSRNFTKGIFLGGAAVVLAIGILSASVVIASASTNSKSCDAANGVKVTNPTVCKGLAFYKGQTVSFIAPTSAGSAYDVTSRAFAKELGIYLGATVNVLDINGGNSVTGMDALAASVPNGLTVGYFNLATVLGDIVTNSPTVNFNIKDIAVFGGEANNIDILATLSTSPYTTFAVLKKDDTATNPVKIVTETGAPLLSVELMMREFGLPATYLTAYINSATAATGFIRGDGPLTGSGIAALQSFIEDGAVRVLVLQTQALKPTTIASLPLYPNLMKSPTSGLLDEKYPPKTNGEKAAARYASAVTVALNYAAGGPSAMPSYLLTTMRAAFEWAAKSTFVKTQILAVGNPASYVSPAVVKANLLKAIAFGPKIETFLGY